MREKPSVTIIYCKLCRKIEFPANECTCSLKEKILLNTKLRNRKAEGK